MKWQHSDRSKADYDNLQPSLKKAFDKQARLLASNLLHPSLHAKKYDERQNVWQAQPNRGWKFFS